MTSGDVSGTGAEQQSGRVFTLQLTNSEENDYFSGCYFLGWCDYEEYQFNLMQQLFTEHP